MAQFASGIHRESKLHQLPESLDNGTSFSSAPPNIAAHYSGDTKPGSSGSPVFSDAWEVVALHHSAVAKINDQGEFLLQSGDYKHPYDIGINDRVKWFANEGIRISRIVLHLDQVLQEGRLDHGAAALVRRVLDAGRHAKQHGHFHHHDIESSGILENRPARVETPVSPVRNEPAPYSSGTVQMQAMTGGVRVTVPLTVSITLGDVGGAIAGIGSDIDFGGGATHVDFLQERRYTIADLSDREGHNPSFLRQSVPLPTVLNTAPGSVAQLRRSSETELRYDHFSVVQNAKRRLAYFSIGNHDPLAPFKPSRDKDPWSIDPRIDEGAQAPNFFYKNNDLDRGHLWRRADGSWGHTEEAAIRADHDTYFWTNIAPQHKVFNRSSLHEDVQFWGGLENHVMAAAACEGERMTVINGPVFSDNDPSHRGLQIPMAFWKIVAFCEGPRLRAMAFRLGQDDLLSDLPAERIEAGEFGVFQVKIRDLERMTHLDFGTLRQADTMEEIHATESFLPGRAEVRLRGPGDFVF